MLNENILHKINPHPVIYTSQFLTAIIGIIIGIIVLLNHQLQSFIPKELLLNYLSIALILCCSLRIFYLYLLIKSTSYTITDQRIIKSSGILNKTTIDCVLYRIREVELHEPLWYRFFGVGNVMLIAIQKLQNQINILAISQPEKIKEEMRTLIELRRAERGINELDTY